jgi:hypothetical protein
VFATTTDTTARPNDQETLENPMGAAFDPRDNLYRVENFGCKKIYKYTGHRAGDQHRGGGP